MQIGRRVHLHEQAFGEAQPHHVQVQVQGAQFLAQRGLVLLDGRKGVAQQRGQARDHLFRRLGAGVDQLRDDVERGGEEVRFQLAPQRFELGQGEAALELGRLQLAIAHRAVAIHHQGDADHHRIDDQLVGQRQQEAVDQPLQEPAVVCVAEHACPHRQSAVLGHGGKTVHVPW